MAHSDNVRLAALLCLSMIFACGSEETGAQVSADGLRTAAPYRAHVSETYLRGPKDICIVTQFTSNMDSFASVASDNHQDYAWRHGYKALAYRGRISGDAFRDPDHPERLRREGLYWQKLAALQQTLARPSDSLDAGGANDARLCQWVMWLDADAIFTNIYQSLETVLAPYADKDVVLPREHMDTLVNAGVFFVKNSPQGRAFVDRIASMFPVYKDHKLPEQEAMQDDAFGMIVPTPYPGLFDAVKARLRPEIGLAPQRAFDSFAIAGSPFNPISSWEPCDFVAHIAGTRADIRVQTMHAMMDRAEECAP